MIINDMFTGAVVVYDRMSPLPYIIFWPREKKLKMAVKKRVTYDDLLPLLETMPCNFTSSPSLHPLSILFMKPRCT